MTRTAKLLGFAAALTLTTTTASAMSFTHYSSSEKDGFWVKSEAKTGAPGFEAAEISSVTSFFKMEAGDGSNAIVTFKGWGTCFNELGWDALQLLPEEKREELLKRIFAPDGDLKYTHASRSEPTTTPEAGTAPARCQATSSSVTSI